MTSGADLFVSLYNNTSVGLKNCFRKHKKRNPLGNTEFIEIHKKRLSSDDIIDYTTLVQHYSLFVLIERRQKHAI